MWLNTSHENPKRDWYNSAMNKDDLNSQRSRYSRCGLCRRLSREFVEFPRWFGLAHRLSIFYPSIFFYPFFFFGKSFFEFRYLTSFVRACGGLNAALSYRGPDFYLQRIAIIFQLCDTHVCLKLCWRIDVVSLLIVWKYHAEDDKVEKFVELRRRQGSCKVSRFVWLIALSITWIQEILACPKPPVIKSCLDRFYRRQDEFLAY